jgi:GAF domain-containing protein
MSGRGGTRETGEQTAKSATRAEAPMAAQPRDRIAEEQAALRRVAVLVAQGAAPEEVFAAVTAEAGRLLDADLAAVGRYSSGDTLTIVARWGTAGNRRPGAHTRLGGTNAGTLVFETGQSVRMDDFSQLSGEGGEVVRQLGIRSSVAVPISVEGLLWTTTPARQGRL